MEEKAQIQAKQQSKDTNQQSQPPTPKIIKAYYESLANVKMIFKLQQIFIKKLDNYELTLPPQTKMLEVKKIIDEMSKRNFNIYVKDSFMPSLNAKIGDLAQCYARYDERQKVYEMNLTIAQTKDFYG